MQLYQRSIFKSLGILSVLVLAFHCTDVQGAPCCARNSATPALIVGDDQAQVNLGFSLVNVVAEASPDGSLKFGSDDASEILHMYRLDSALMLSDRVQASASFSLFYHGVAQSEVADHSVGMGDTRLSLAYEILPVWNYSKWKPQIFMFSVLTLPTGLSKYESKNREALLSDVTGNGFYSVSVGSLLIKRWNNWDVFLLPEIHYAFSRNFQNFLGEIEVIPGWGGSLGFGGGWSPGGGSLRIGLRIQPRLDQATKTNLAGRSSQVNGLLSVCDTGLDMSYLLGTSDTLMLALTDQTLLGVATNLNVNRSIALNYQHRWER